MTEAALHKAVAQFLDKGLPREACWTTFPAGGGGKVRGAQLKARGLKPGWPDIQILTAGRLVCIELKVGKNPTSPEQIECHAALNKAGARVYVCRSLPEVQAALRDARVPFHANAWPGGAIEYTRATAGSALRAG